MIDIDAIIHEQAELKKVSEDVGEVRRRLLRHLAELSDAWRSNESRALCGSCEEVSAILKRVSEELFDIGQAVSITGNEIIEEETLLLKSEAEETGGQ